MVQEIDGLAATDCELATAAAAGRSGAFDELYRRHAESAWRVAYAVTGNRDDAADAVADAFTRVFTALSAGRVNDLDRFRAYLLATVRNAAVDVLRRGGRIRPTDRFADTASPASGPSDRMVEGVDAALVASAFRSLPERWRSVLWLTEVEGMAPAEAAGLLGVSANGLAQLAVRARAGLRQRFLQAHLKSDVLSECRFTVERLGAYVGGGLAPRDIAKVDQHLADCHGCRDRLAELQDLGSTLRRIALPLPLALAPLAWEHWQKTRAARAAAVTRTGRAGVPAPAQRALMGASVGLLGLGIIGATLVGQPPFGSGAARAAGAAPVGVQPTAVEQNGAAASGVPALPLALSAPASAAGAGATDPGSAAGAGGAPTPSTVSPTGPSVPAGGVVPTQTPGLPSPLPSSPLPSAPLPSLPLGGGGSGGTSSPAQITTQVNLAPGTTAVVAAGTDSTGATLTNGGSTTPVTVPSTTTTTSPPPSSTTTTTTAPSATITVTSPLTGTQSLTLP